MHFQNTVYLSPFFMNTRIVMKDLNLAVNQRWQIYPVNSESQRTIYSIPGNGKFIFETICDCADTDTTILIFNVLHLETKQSFLLSSHLINTDISYHIVALQLNGNIHRICGCKRKFCSNSETFSHNVLYLFFGVI